MQLGQHLQSGVTADMGDGAPPAEVLAALQEEAGEPGVYAALLELLTIASLDELAVLADLPASDITPSRDESPAPPPRPVPRRRRR